MRLLPHHKPLRAMQPGGDFLHSLGEATLDDYLPMLLEGTTNGHVMPLRNQSIAPCSKLVDAGCRIELDRDWAKVIYKDKVIFKDDCKNSMWYLILPDKSAFTPPGVLGPKRQTAQLNNLRAGGAIQLVYQLGQVKEVVLFLHAAFCSPSRHLLRAAILGGSNLLNGWPVFGPNPH